MSLIAVFPKLDFYRIDLQKGLLGGVNLWKKLFQTEHILL